MMNNGSLFRKGRASTLHSEAAWFCSAQSVVPSVANAREPISRPRGPAWWSSAGAALLRAKGKLSSVPP